MNAMTVQQAKDDFEQLVEHVLADVELTIVVTESGKSIVLFPLEEYNAWLETHYLLTNPANAAHLKRSIAQAENGQVVEQELIEP